MDYVLPILRESMVWIPLYVFLILFAYLNYSIKGLYWIGFAILTIVVSNYISSNIIKPWYNLPRPCVDAYIPNPCRLLLNRCPGHGSFTSSHATNHFALATLVYYTLRKVANWPKWLYLWAASISYAQVYVGVHYPLDVLCGALLGYTVGYIGQLLYHLFIGTLHTIKSSSIT